MIWARAVSSSAYSVKWEFKLFSPPFAGGLTTAGNVLFGASNEGDFYSLDATSGRLLWRIQTGAGISANPISYLSGGKQQVAIAAGNTIFAFAVEE